MKKFDLLQKSILKNGLRKFSLDYAKATDIYIKDFISQLQIWNELIKSKTEPTLVAAGGYGRGELSMESDLDIFILFKDRIPRRAELLAKQFFHPLWDMGFEIGYGIRTIRDCIQLSKRDNTVFTSLLDMRYLSGSEDNYLLLREKIYSELIRKKGDKLIQNLIGTPEKHRPHINFGANFLEPNLKEGLGGLRDYHHVRWVNSILDFKINQFTNSSRYELSIVAPMLPHIEFIEAIRNILHMITRRKYDILKIDKQSEVAKMSYKYSISDTENTKQFLRNLLDHLLEMRLLRNAIIHQFEGCNPRILKGQKVSGTPPWQLTSPGFGKTDPPSTTLRIMMEDIISGKSITYPQLQGLREILKGPICQEGKVILLKYLDSVIERKDSARIFEMSLRVGILEYLIEPFKEIKNLLQHGTYHLYPVDVHLIETLRFLSNIEAEGSIFEKTLLYEIRDKKLLLWAAFLHDIGKGKNNHHIRGAKIAKAILKNLGMDKCRIERAAFLIKNHLLLAQTATKKNLNEEKVVVECARQIKDPEMAKMLYLMTWADSKATGPKAWNYWVEYLVQDLFLKALRVIEGGNLASVDSTMRSRKNLKKAKELLIDLIPKTKLEEVFQHMGIRYAIENPPTDIKLHVQMAMEFLALLKTKREALVFNWREYEREKILELTIVTMDHPGLFSQIAGVLALNNLNILDAKAYTWSNGIVIDRLEVTYPPDPLKHLEVRSQVEMDMLKAIKGELDLSKLLSQKIPLMKRDISHENIELNPKVLVDNTQSDFFTVIEVHSKDRIGLLYEITRTLTAFDLDIRFAKIYTRAEEVLDYFYVKDKFGQKLTDPEKIGHLKETLIQRLAS